MTAQITMIIIKSIAYNAELGGDRGALVDRAETPESFTVSWKIPPNMIRAAIGDTLGSFGLMENGELIL
jgi:hypothetical protein